MDGKSLLPIVNGSEPRVRDLIPVIQVWGTAGTLALSVVTETHKYVYWIYGEDVAATEELFDLRTDPYEMRNLANQPEHRAVAETMRQHYDAEVARWKEQAVPYNDYQPFGTLLDRTIPWEEKKQLLPRQFSRTVVESSRRAQGRQ